MNKTVSLLSTTALLAAVAAPAQAETLRLADSLPVGHYVAEEGLKPWMEALAEATGGDLTMEYYPASQLGQGKDMLALTQSGVTDVALIQPAYISEKLPLSGIIELPELFESSCAGTKAFFESAQPGGILGDEEYAPEGVRTLFATVLAPYQLLTTDKPVDSVEDMQGLKIRTGGGTQDLLIEKLGGVPVRVPGPEMYEALSRGTADGIVIPYSSVFSYDLQEVLSYSTVSGGFGTTVTAYMISEDRWEELTEAQQEALTQTGWDASMRLCAYVDEAAAQAEERLSEEGVEVIQMPEDAQAAMSDLLREVSTEWSERLDGRGLKASALLEEMSGAASSN